MGAIKLAPKDLLDALAAVKPAVNTRSAIAAHAGVRIQSTIAGPVMYAGTVYSGMVQRVFSGEQIGDIDLVVGHAHMVKIAKAFAKSESVTLTDDGERALTCSNANGRIISAPKLLLSDCDEWVPVGGELIVSGPARAIKAALLKADVFRSHDTTRPILCGIRLEDSVMVTTDSYRLAKFKLPGWIATIEHAVTLDGAQVALASKSMPKDERNVLIYSADKHTHIRWAGTTWLSRNVDGQYPNYKQLVPEQDTFTTVLRADTSKLLEGAKLAKDFCERNAPVRLTLNQTSALNIEAAFSGQSPDGPSFEEQIAGASGCVGEPPSSVAKSLSPHHGRFEMGLNPEFLADILASIASETTRIRMISPLRPALIENTENDDESYLLMPIRLNV